MFLPAVVVSGSLHVYVSQTDRGRTGLRRGGGSAGDLRHRRLAGVRRGTRRPRAATHARAGQDAAAAAMVGTLRHDPRLLADHRLHRPSRASTATWAGGPTGSRPPPVAGEQLAACIAGGETPELIAPFGLSRFAEGRLVGEKGAGRGGGALMLLVPVPVLRPPRKQRRPDARRRDRAAPRPVGDGRRRSGRAYLYEEHNPAGWTRETWHCRTRLRALLRHRAPPHHQPLPEPGARR